jgi:Zn-dependent peptidase ImmA (M78 family)
MNWIDEIVKGTVDMYETMDPFELCDYMEIVLHTTGKGSAILQGQHSMYVRNFFNHECIFYSEGLRLKRLKFYIMHELGHALLHPDVPCSNLTNNMKLEQQANYFAIKMLLPNDIEYYVDKPIQLVAMEHDIPDGVLRIG